MLGVNVTPPPPPPIDKYNMYNSPVTHFDLNLSDSLHKCSKTSGRQCNSGNQLDYSLESLTDDSDSMLEVGRNASANGGEVKSLGAFLKIEVNPHRMQLQREVEKLQQELEDEMELRNVLENAVELSALASSDLSCIPENAKELLSSIALLEITVSDLEEEMLSLQCQLSQERNERKLAEYHLKRSSSQSPFLQSPDNMKRLHSYNSSSRSLEPSMVMSIKSRALSRTRRMDEPSENSCSTSYINTMNQATEDSVLSFKDEIASAKNPQHVTSNDGMEVEGNWDQPNKLSEEMVMCMKNIFISLADSSTLSSKLRALKMNCPPFSPQSECSTNPQVDTESTGELFGAKNAFDPYKVHGKLSWADIGIYGSAIEVSWMSVGKKQLEYAAGALRRFRLLVEQLAKVNPIHLSDNEKLAFWINIYNALIMHAYLAYGVPKSDLKLFSLMQKAQYTVGGHSFSAAAIEYVILKMQPPVHRPQTALVLGLHKLKVPEEQQKYSIDVHEPLVAFALSCGMYSSPAVRVYSVHNVREELQHAQRDFVRASVGVSRRGKLFMPRMLYEFASKFVDDLNLGAWVAQYLPPHQELLVERCISKRRQSFLGRSSTAIVPFDSRFRYLFLPVVPDSKLCSSTLQ
ncbi:hypothetical protein MKW94_030108 [Papaver nudicaule]|uniref:Uncharacterized protein n=1 Tax=Papaver nudicaule TaxID=74823 RepID=A0AA42AXJ5_PAPNU|nr:hypothetical protein [Papaver nudicaule]MCL7044023.1 hypothetical protein [Papaver nudicaule]